MTGTESHLSIGEVLSLLQAEFPDVTISKIRFLESQGLVDPERTPSGYRKFYEPDVERLRWILEQQRDNFLPLKVIKDRLEAAGGVPTETFDNSEYAPTEDSVEIDLDTAEVTTITPPARPQLIERAAPAVPNLLDAGPTEVSLSAEELCTTAGITMTDLGELEKFGLLAPRLVGADRYYDGDSLVVARSAAAFRRFGVEARHLRMYKVASEREAGFLEQVVMPLRKQRNPESRQRAIETVAELAGLGRQLHAALLRQALSDELN